VTTLVGLDLAGRRVVVAGAGEVGARRAWGLAAEGAHVVLVDPAPSDAARALAAAPPGGGVELVERAVAEADVDGAWLVVAATANVEVDAAVAGWSEARRTWCIHGAAGSARSVATSRHDDLVVGVVSDADPDPRRVAAVRDALSSHLSAGKVDLRRRREHRGRVVLVGGGPGDPKLVTLAGAQALAAADVVVADRLGTAGLLERLPPDVEVIDVGKTASRHPVPQTEINRLLVERARQGQLVVRLKGGDPFVYGRGGEELHACREAGVDVVVLPGVSSALAVPALAGIPLTQRGVSSSVHVSSGHAGAEPAAVAALAAGATLVLLMAVGTLAEICDAALDAGVGSSLPVAIIENGSTGQERVTHATLATAARTARDAGVRPPAVVVVGAVAAEGFIDGPACATEAGVPQVGPEPHHPALVVCAHGTRDPLGRATVREVVHEVALRLPGVAVYEAYVDVHGPDVAEVVAGLRRDPERGVCGVVVPLLLAAGYHVHVDIARAVADRPDVRTTGALGPDDLLVDLLVERLEAAGAVHGQPVVLAPAGSSDERAQADSADMAARLAQRWGGPVRLGYAAGPAPAVAEAIASARDASGGAPVAVASYLLAPGFFQQRLDDSGADVVTGPLAPDPRIIEIVLARYRAALEA